MDDRLFLENANIIKLQSCARMAGLRWRSGDPEYNKAGIINKLLQHPSIARATIAALKRLDNKGPADWLNDDYEEPQPLSVQPNGLNNKPASEASPIEPFKPSHDYSALQQSIDKALQTIGVIQRTYCTIPQAGEIFEKGIKPIRQSLDSLAESIIALQKQTPIQFNFPAQEPILINPSEHHASYPKLLTYLQVNRRVILVGSAGTGKSMAVKNAAKALGVDFYLVPPVTMSHELIGHRDAQGVFHETPLTLAYKHGGLCLLDEADASLPDALLCANPILDGNGFATLGDGELHAQHKDFYAVFNMNTDGNGATMQYSGRNRLDGATIARFGVRIQWDIDPRIEGQMAQGQDKWHAAIKAIRLFMQQRDIVDVNATPRHLKTGAALLAAGCAKQEVLTDCLKSGALGEVWADVTRLPAVAQFLNA